MKKKKLIPIIILIIVVIVIIVIIINNKKTNNNENQQKEAFSIKYNGVQIVPGTEFFDNRIKEDYRLSEITSCAFEGKDKLYTYNSLEITVAKIEGKDKIYSVYFLSPEQKTEEGVRITDSKELMLEKYGKQYEQTLENKYTYTRGNVELSFIIENDIISSIEYTLKT